MEIKIRLAKSLQIGVSGGLELIGLLASFGLPEIGIWRRGNLPMDSFSSMAHAAKT